MKRRDFLKKGASSSMAFALSGLIISPVSASGNIDGAMSAIRSYLLSSDSSGETKTFNISANSQTTLMIDNTTVFTWNLKDEVSSGPGKIGSGMIVTEGDTVEVNLTNNLDRNINFVVEGVLQNSDIVVPGQTKKYTFSAPSAGTYMYTDSTNGYISKAMGLFGPLVLYLLLILQNFIQMVQALIDNIQ